MDVENPQVIKGKDIQEAFNRDGFVGPLDAIGQQEMSSIRRELDEQIFSKQATKPQQLRRNRHLDWNLVAKLCSNQIIVDSVEQILGSDLILWQSMFISRPKGKGHNWHSNKYPIVLSDMSQQVAVRLAITESFEDDCVFLLPGSHKMSDRELSSGGFKAIPASAAYGANGYYRTDECTLKPIKMILKPGQFFIFHPYILHASLDLTEEDWKSKKYEKKGLVRLWERAIQKISLSKSRRLELDLRITVPEVTVLPKAFQGTLPRIDKCILLRGKDNIGVNKLGSWG